MGKVTAVRNELRKTRERRNWSAKTVVHAAPLGTKTIRIVAATSVQRVLSHHRKGAIDIEKT